MTQGIVEHLEPVQVNHDQPHLAHLPVRNVQGMGQVFHKEPAIGQASEGIGGFQSLQVHLHGDTLINLPLQLPAGFQKRLVTLEDQLDKQSGQAGKQAHKDQACESKHRPGTALAVDPGLIGA